MLATSAAAARTMRPIRPPSLSLLATSVRLWPQRWHPKVRLSMPVNGSGLIRLSVIRDEHLGYFGRTIALMAIGVLDITQPARKAGRNNSANDDG